MYLNIKTIFFLLNIFFSINIFLDYNNYKPCTFYAKRNQIAKEDCDVYLSLSVSFSKICKSRVKKWWKLEQSLSRIPSLNRFSNGSNFRKPAIVYIFALNFVCKRDIRFVEFVIYLLSRVARGIAFVQDAAYPSYRRPSNPANALIPARTKLPLLSSSFIEKVSCLSAPSSSL